MILMCLAHSSGDLWFSSPSRLNRKFANDGTKIAKYRETVYMATEITLTAPFQGLHTPRTCLLRAAVQFTRRGLE